MSHRRSGRDGAQTASGQARHTDADHSLMPAAVTSIRRAMTRRRAFKFITRFDLQPLQGVRRMAGPISPPRSTSASMR